jgi:hypothetical protein
VSEVANKVVETMLENEQPLDPKYFSARVPTIYDDAIAEAKAAFNDAVDGGRIYNAKTADEVGSEVAMDACEAHGLDDNDDYEEVVTEVFKLAAELFPGDW